VNLDFKTGEGKLNLDVNFGRTVLERNFDVNMRRTA
jgi:hypothetical protein